MSEIDPTSYIIGDKIIRTEEITPAGWVAILEKFLTTLKPIMGDCTGWSEIKDLLNSPDKSFGGIETAEDTITFCREVSLTTRYWKMKDVFQDSKGKYEMTTDSESYRRMLILTERGEWVLLDEKRQIGTVPGRDNYRLDIALYSNFIPVDKKMLTAIIGHNLGLGLALTEAFRVMISQSLISRRAQAERLTEAATIISPMLNKIDWFRDHGWKIV